MYKVPIDIRSTHSSGFPKAPLESKNVAGQTTSFLRDGAYVTDPVIADSLATYTPGVSERRGGTTRYTHSGLKNTGAQSTNAIFATRVYDAYGMVRSTTGTWSGPFGYRSEAEIPPNPEDRDEGNESRLVGRNRDAGGYGYQEDETGLRLLGHRYYDASTGRFLTRDPIKDGRNWYSYADGDPINGVDPNGLLHLDITINEDGLGTGKLVADAGDVIGYSSFFGVPIPIIAVGGEVLHEFEVGNRVPSPGTSSDIKDGNGPYPPGSSPIDDWLENYKTLGSTIRTRGGAAQRRGTWVHTGRGENFRAQTLGCIRMKQSDMDIVFAFLNLNRGRKHKVNVRQKGKRSRKNEAPLRPSTRIGGSRRRG